MDYGSRDFDFFTERDSRPFSLLTIESFQSFERFESKFRDDFRFVFILETGKIRVRVEAEFDATNTGETLGDIFTFHDLSDDLGSLEVSPFITYQLNWN